MITWQSVVPTTLAIISLIELGDGLACAQTPDKYRQLIGFTNYSHHDLNDARLRYPQDVIGADGKKQFKNKPAKNAEVSVEPDPESLVSIDSLLVALKTSLATNRILVADCCRDDPNRPRAICRSFGSSLNINQLPERTVVLFACDAMQQAFEHSDWGHGGNGTLTKCLLEQIQKAPKDLQVFGGQRFWSIR